MKTKIIAVGLVATVVTPIVWFVGVIGEYEYPYAITVYRASHAKTATGASAASVVAKGLDARPSQLDWHRCSFCANFDLSKSMVRVQVSVVPRENYIFAFDTRRGILYPADEETAEAFPTMEVIGQLGEALR